jgi:hypothetical protein
MKQEPNLSAREADTEDTQSSHGIKCHPKGIVIMIVRNEVTLTFLSS